MSVTASATALVTIEVVKTYMSLRDGSDDNLIQMIINDVSADIQTRICQRTLKSTAYTGEKYDGDGTSLLKLKNWPVISVASLVIEEDGDAQVANDDYYLYADEGIIRLDGKIMPISFQKVVVTYTAGWATLPEDIVYAAKMAVAHRFRVATFKHDGIVSQAMSVGGSNQSAQVIEGEYSRAVMKIFDKYKRKDVRR